MTITYEYEGALYVNLTNRCDCACVFCLRHNGHDGSIYADDLWLEHEPSREEALESFFTWGDLAKYREIAQKKPKFEDIAARIERLEAETK